MYAPRADPWRGGEGDKKGGDKGGLFKINPIQFSFALNTIAGKLNNTKMTMELTVQGRSNI